MKKEAIPSWNLSDLYKNNTDPRITTTLQTQLQRAEIFAKNYRNKIITATSQELLKIIKEYESILQEESKPVLYASLVFAADSKNQKNGAFFQKMQAETLKISQKLVFLELEIAHAKEEQINQWINDSQLKNYKHYLEKQKELRKHRLSEAEEKLLNEKTLTGCGAWQRLFNEVLSSKQFPYQEGKTKEMLSETAALNLLYNHDRKKRKAAADAFTEGLRQEAKILTLMANTLVQDKAIDDKYRNFSTPESYRHVNNEMTQEIVDLMSEVIIKNYTVVQEFYKFKKKVLKLEKLYDYDRYAPVVESKKHIPFEEAQTIVLNAYDQFSPIFAKTAEEFFKKGWIDADLRDGKKGGAFCTYVTPDLHPYVLVNYTGNIKEVLTIAHELGHGVNACLMRKQSYINFDHPLTMAETASIFGEMMVFDAVKETLPPKEKFALYMQKIEEIFASVFRQTAMYKFEQDFHAKQKEHGEQTTEEINKLWRNRQVQMFGKAVELSPGYDYWWMYISHFWEAPFYVYAYACAELLVLSLYAQYKKEGKPFVPKYIKLLETGGSASPQDALKPLSIDLTKREFWEGGINLIKEMIKEAERLYKKI